MNPAPLPLGNAAAARAGSYPKGVARRQEILTRAIEVFAAKGAEGTSLRAIAEAIGVSHAALLHYFPSREVLLIEVLKANETRSRDEDADRDPTEIVGMMINAAHRNVGIPGIVSLYSSMLAGSIEEGKDYSREYFSGRFERLRAKLVARIRAGQSDGTVRADLEPEALAALVIAASDGLQLQWLLDPKVDIAKSLELLDVILAPTEGLAGTPTTTPTKEES